MKEIPNLSFWKLWDISFGFFGVQIAYALQSANISRIFSTFGADPHSLSYFGYFLLWLALSYSHSSACSVTVLGAASDAVFLIYSSEHLSPYS